MPRLASLLLIACVFSAPLEGQHGTAPNGYYPEGYAGSIFTGSLESANADTQEITLVYTKGNKSERFVGRLESACNWKDKGGAAHSLTASDIPKGSVLTAFYDAHTTKSGGEKIKENFIFSLSWAEVNGKRIPEEKRVVISCSNRAFQSFKAF